MSNGTVRIVLANMARPSTPKRSALKSALNTKTFENKVASVKGNEKQPCKKGKY